MTDHGTLLLSPKHLTMLVDDSAIAPALVLQRGYQASSQVISTANDMLQELFQLKSK